MKPGMTPGSSHVEFEALSDLTETAAGFSPEGIWALVAILEHAPRRWMTDFMEAGEQSVGAQVTIERVLPAPLMGTVRATATLCQIRGRRYVFAVELRNAQGDLLATGTNERAVIAIPAAG